jgi:peptide subunit release factor 1 (eRF1)
MATLYIPGNKNLDGVCAMLLDDLKSKDNIKKPVNRQNTKEAVSNMMRMVASLKTKHVTVDSLGYPNGVIVLSGVTSSGNMIEYIIGDPP